MFVGVVIVLMICSVTVWCCLMHVGVCLVLRSYCCGLIMLIKFVAVRWWLFYLVGFALFCYDTVVGWWLLFIY